MSFLIKKILSQCYIRYVGHMQRRSLRRLKDMWPLLICSSWSLTLYLVKVFPSFRCLTFKMFCHFISLLRDWWHPVILCDLFSSLHSLLYSSFRCFLMMHAIATWFTVYSLIKWHPLLVKTRPSFYTCSWITCDSRSCRVVLHYFFFFFK